VSAVEHVSAPQRQEASLVEHMGAEPWRFDFYSVLRRIERSFADRPRIGDSAARRDEYITLGQDPYMDFPASNLSRFERDADGRFNVLVKFLGLLGPQGALPLATTEEAYSWNLMRDDAFPRFLDILNNRFLQLFFRAWSDARPIGQHDRPDADRFVTYVGAMIGIGSDPFRKLDSVPDAAKMMFAGLMGPASKSASRLRGLVAGLFGVAVEIDEFVGSRLVFEESERTRIGRRNCGLGTDLLVGGSVFSVQDKFRIRLFVETMADYVAYLPTGGRCEPLADLVFFYIGEQLEWEVELAIPAGAIEPVRLSRFGQLGWTSWMAPNWSQTDRAWRCDARFHPAEILTARRARPS
jgi:type VI secretion system protein ImpH